MQEGLAAVFGNGLSTACVVNIGAQVTSVICIEVCCYLHPFVSICSEDFDPHIDATVVAEGLGYCCGIYFVFRFQLPTAEFEVIELLI